MPVIDLRADYAARTAAHWAAERAKLAAEIRAAAPNYSVALAWFENVRRECYDHPAFPNYTALINARQRA